jgi:ubiquinone/menaquinone biosynthesis C-methylase UbiE
MRDELLEEELYWFREAKYRVLEGKRGVRRCYDEMAKRYEDSRYLYWTRRMEEGEERAIKGWLERLEPPILDVGCGTGRYTLSLVARDSTVVALDLSPGMIKRLRGKGEGIRASPPPNRRRRRAATES